MDASRVSPMKCGWYARIIGSAWSTESQPSPAFEINLGRLIHGSRAARGRERDSSIMIRDTMFAILPGDTRPLAGRAAEAWLQGG
jgi:hypothetical protein